MFRVTVIVAAAFALLSPSVALAADELSTTDRLDARRFVTAGPRAYEVGTEAGRYSAAGFGGADRERWLTALVPADCHERTTGLSATLLELAAHGRIAAPVHPLVDPGAARWRDALAQLESAGASTGRAYAVAVGETLRALVS